MKIHPHIAWGLIAVACVGFIAAALGIQNAVFLAGGILVLWWTMQYPEESFLTLIVLSALLPMLKVTQTLGNITLVKDVIIIGLFTHTFLIPLLTQRLPYRRNLLLAPVIALGGWAALSVLRAGITTLSILRLRDITLYMLLYFAVLYLPHTKGLMKRRLIVFLATLLITMALGIFQFLHLPDSTVLRFDPVRQIWIPRMASTFAHPTVFAEYLITGSMLLLGLLLTTRSKKIGIVIFLLTTFALLYFTYTRAAWIGAVAALFAVAVTHIASLLHIQHPRKLIQPVVFTLVGFCIIAGILFTATPVGTFVKSAFDPSYASNADRIVFFVHLISQTSNIDAVIGKGLGNTITQTREGGDATAFDIASGESRTIQLSKDQTLVDNQYLKTFIEMGVVGLVLTGWLLWRFLRASRIALYHKETYGFGIACIGFLAAFIVQALFVDIWDVYPTNAIFWVLGALVMEIKERPS